MGGVYLPPSLAVRISCSWSADSLLSHDPQELSYKDQILFCIDGGDSM